MYIDRERRQYVWYLTVLGIARSWRGNYDLRVRKKLRAGLAIMHGFSGYGKTV